MNLKPFAISVDQSSLDELMLRLRQTRWPDEPHDAGWSMGTNLSFMRELVTYWLDRYDWRAQERALNQLAQFKAEVDGEEIHLFHAPSPDRGATPLLLLHGWPDSNFRFAKVIPKLAESVGGQSFHVVAPSLPGFGFSTHRAMDNAQLTSLLVNLMKGLGYERFFVAGGDIGSIVAMTIADLAPEAVRGMHLTDVGYPDHTTDFASLSPKEQEFARTVQNWWMREGAYAMVQSTKPQSLAYAMNDSPSGPRRMDAVVHDQRASGQDSRTLHARRHHHQRVHLLVHADRPSSFRAYYESAKAMYGGQKPLARSSAPTAVLHPAWDAPLPTEWANRRTNLQRYSELERSGHFAAWEKPLEFVSDLRKFAATVTTSG